MRPLQGTGLQTDNCLVRLPYYFSRTCKVPALEGLRNTHDLCQPTTLPWFLATHPNNRAADRDASHIDCRSGDRMHLKSLSRCATNPTRRAGNRSRNESLPKTAAQFCNHGRRTNTCLAMTALAFTSTFVSKAPRQRAGNHIDRPALRLCRCSLQCLPFRPLPDGGPSTFPQHCGQTRRDLFVLGVWLTLRRNWILELLCSPTEVRGQFFNAGQLCRCRASIVSYGAYLVHTTRRDLLFHCLTTRARAWPPSRAAHRHRAITVQHAPHRGQHGKCQLHD